jgi:hypothetical protein
MILIDKGNLGNYLANGFIGLVAGTLLYSFTLKTMQEIADRNTPEITSVSQLEASIKDEKRNLRIADSICIQGEINETGMPHPEKIGENKYRIFLTNQKHSKAVLQHEMYHIAGGHVDTNPSNKIVWSLYDTFWAEPTAELYSTTGIQF